MLDLLRKLGILRYGVKTGKYTSAKDMPTEFLMDDVTNAEKDLVNKQDVEKVREGLKTPKGKKILKWIIIAIVGFIGVAFLLGVISGLNEDTTAVKGHDSAQKSEAAVVSQPAAVATKSLTVSSAALTPADEIHQVFEKVRQANFDEDINTFMTYYANDFPDRSGKRQKTLDTWNKYDFASLDFFIFDLNINGQQAHASIGWEIALLENGSAKPRLIETTNEVDLVKVGADWQIVSLQ